MFKREKKYSRCLVAFLCFILANNFLTAEEEINHGMPYSNTRSERITVKAKEDPCCGTYFSSIDAHINLKYFNKDLPWGVKVYLVYGFKRVMTRPDIYWTADWQFMNEVEMPASASWTWSSKFSQNLARRGSSEVYSNLQFVFKIVYPDGSVEWSRGSENELGFYETAGILSYGYPQVEKCVAGTEDAEGFCQLKLFIK